MAKVTIEVLDEVRVTKGPKDKAWLSECVVALGKLDPTIIAKLAAHGLVQKIADAASGAKTKDDADAAMGKAMDALVAGEWSSRGTGTGADEATIVARSVTRAAFKASAGAKSKAWAEFTGLSDADQIAKLDEWFAKNEAKLRPAVDLKLKQRQAEREARKEAAKGVDFAL